jgi:hypothetical protein
MHGPINVKSPNNTGKLQMGFNSAFKGLRDCGVWTIKYFGRVGGLSGGFHYKGFLNNTAAITRRLQ